MSQSNNGAMGNTIAENSEFILTQRGFFQVHLNQNTWALLHFTFIKMWLLQPGIKHVTLCSTAEWNATANYPPQSVLHDEAKGVLAIPWPTRTDGAQCLVPFDLGRHGKCKSLAHCLHTAVRKNCACNAYWHIQCKNFDLPHQRSVEPRGKRYTQCIFWFGRWIYLIISTKILLC